MRVGFGPAWDRSGRIGIDRAQPVERGCAAGLFLLGVAWLLYTRLYFYLHPRGWTYSASAFMHLTHRPDPTCGMTRTFAWMWRGDLVHAVVVYPIGPVVFVATLALVAYLAVVTATGRTLRLHLSRRTWKIAIVTALIVLGLNWTAKLLWLGI